MSRRRLPRTRVGELTSQQAGPVRVCGLADRVTAADGAQPAQVVLREPSGAVALVCEAGSDAAAVAAELRPGSAIDAVGTPQAGPAGVRLHAEALAVPGPAHADPPVSADSPRAARLDWRAVDLRRPANQLLVAAQTTLERALRDFWARHDFVELHTPKLRHVPNKAGDLFRVDYFDRSAYLTQSPQFYKQMAMAAGFDRVFEIGPAFRAEPTVSARHATEFTSIDLELAWIDSDEDVMALVEALLAEALAAVRAAHGEEIADCFGAAVRVPSLPFPRVRLDEAWQIVAATGHPPDADGGELDADAEQRLAGHIAEACDHEFVFVTHYPAATRPFFHMRGEPPSASRSFDLLWKGWEIASGAQREHRYDQLVAQARAHEVPGELIAHFLDFFKHGCPPHGGAGLGLARLLTRLVDVDDLREVTYLFRGPDRLAP